MIYVTQWQNYIRHLSAFLSPYICIGIGVEGRFKPKVLISDIMIYVIALSFFFSYLTQPTLLLMS